jgi:hypothetical protein
MVAAPPQSGSGQAHASLGCGGGKSAGELGWLAIWRLGRRRWGKVEAALEGRWVDAVRRRIFWPNFSLPHGLKLKTVRGKCNSREKISSKFRGVRGACWGCWIWMYGRLRACLTASVKGSNPQNNYHLWVVAKKSAQITLKRRER